MYDINYMEEHFFKINISNNKFINKYLHDIVLIYNKNGITKGEIVINNNRYIKFNECINNKWSSHYRAKYKFSYCIFYLPREFWKIGILKESFNHNLNNIYLNLHKYIRDFL